MSSLKPTYVSRLPVSPDSEREQVRGQQRGAEDEENIGGEDPSLHHLCLPNAEGALLLRVLKHELSAEKERETEREEDEEIRDAERGMRESSKENKINRDNENTREKTENARQIAKRRESETVKATCQIDLLYCRRLNVRHGSANKIKKRRVIHAFFNT